LIRKQRTLSVFLGAPGMGVIYRVKIPNREGRSSG